MPDEKEVKAPFTNLFLQNVTEKAVDQDEFGFKKYGKYLNPLDTYDWLNMAMEEFVDLGKYLVAERVKRDAILLEIRDSILHVRRGEVPVEDSLEFIWKKIHELSKNLDGMEQGKASK